MQHQNHELTHSADEAGTRCHGESRKFARLELRKQPPGAGLGLAVGKGSWGSRLLLHPPWGEALWIHDGWLILRSDILS